MSIVKWEYLVFEFMDGDIDDYGNLSWEAVSSWATPRGDGSFCVEVLMKRPASVDGVPRFYAPRDPVKS